MGIYNRSWWVWINRNCVNMNAENATYFDNFRVKNVPKEIRKFIWNKYLITNIYRIQACNSIMCLYFCIRCIDVMLKGQTLLEYTHLLYPIGY